MVTHKAYNARARRLVTPLFRNAVGRRAALRLAAARGRSLVLLYHRVLPDGMAPRAIVPTVSSSVFRQHLHALLSVGRIVPLGQLLQPPRPGEGPRFQSPSTMITQGTWERFYQTFKRSGSPQRSSFPVVHSTLCRQSGGRSSSTASTHSGSNLHHAHLDWMRALPRTSRWPSRGCRRLTT